MKSYTQLKTKVGQLSQNTSVTNLSLAGDIMNDEQRYLLQKVFQNEGTFSQSTVGNQNLTATATLAINATSLTLSSVWGYHTTTSTITFSNGNTRIANFTRGSASVTWSVGLSASATASIVVGGLQFYPLPPNYSKLKTLTITQGNLKWTPTEILTRVEWDRMNAFPYYSDIPNNYYIYNNQIGIWPIPVTTGNTVTCNYKYRTPDLSIEDYAVGTASVAKNGTTVTGTGTTWTPTANIQNESRWIQFTQTSGDNAWYQISTVDTATQITLTEPYQGIAVVNGAYNVGQMPIILEDFQDMLVYKYLTYYFSTKVKNPESYSEFKSIYDDKMKLLEEYSGNKTIHVDLRQNNIGQNPNLFQQNIG